MHLCLIWLCRQEVRRCNIPRHLDSRNKSRAREVFWANLSFSHLAFKVLSHIYSETAVSFRTTKPSSRQQNCGHTKLASPESFDNINSNSYIWLLPTKGIVELIRKLHSASRVYHKKNTTTVPLQSRAPPEIQRLTTIQVPNGMIAYAWARWRYWDTLPSHLYCKMNINNK